MSISTQLTPDRKRIQISFPYDPALVEKVKSIPGAKWDRDCRVWTISTRYQKHLDELTAAGHQSSGEFINALGKRANEIKEACPQLNVKIDLLATGCVIQVSGRAHMRPIKIAIPAARWIEGTGYRIEVSTMDRVDKLIAALRDIQATHEESVELMNRITEENRIQREEEAAEKAAADTAAGRGRMGVLVRSAPAIGTVLRHGGVVVRITGHGKQFYLGEDDASMGWGPGCEGEAACYAYYERASAEEIAALEAGETKAAEERRIADARRQAITTVAASPDMPDLGAVPEGETIWEDNAHRATGYRTWIVRTPDGWLWHLTYDGSDGGTWGMRNCGENTVGRRVPATDDLVAAIGGKA